MFITKKQKKLMRDRRKKKVLAEKGLLSVEGGGGNDTNRIQPRSSTKPGDLPSRKRARPDDNATLHADQSVEVHGPDTDRVEKDLAMTDGHATTIIVPSNLPAKEAKKFRKDARRKVRAAGGDDNKIEFVIEGSEPKERPQKIARKKKDFPRINDLLLAEKKKQQEEEAEKERKEKENAIPDEVKARYVAVDCEMVGIGTDGRKSVLARVSITDWHGKVLMDSFVQVPTRVTDYRTHVSGVKPQHLRESKAMTPAECREQVAAIFKDKILVGHALKNDLDALMLQHPKEDIRDTTKYRPYQRYGGNKWRPRKLRDLAKEHLGMVIQQAGESHDSIDDARAAMELYKKARDGWELELARKAKKLKK